MVPALHQMSLESDFNIHLLSVNKRSDVIGKFKNSIFGKVD
jgi:hypothetical protein